jgi:hypothetical protein
MPSRREFLETLSLTAAGSLLPAAGRGQPTLQPSGTGPASPGAKPYGSGYFGEWIADEFGLPAYRYTCDQIHDPKAKTPTNPEWRSPTDQTHQVGNDRIVAAVSNYGYVQVRQDEGSPKFLNDYDPVTHQYGGGIGFLTDGHLTLGTFYPGNAESFERVFGMGYFRKIVRGGPYSIDQVMFAPFGDDPVLISQVTLTNRGADPADLRWIEYWGCRMYQFSYRSLMLSAMNPRKTPELRRKLADRFTHGFRVLERNAGLVESKHFEGRTPEDEAGWAALQKWIAANPNSWFGPPVIPGAPEVTTDDLNPPPTFLVSLDAPADGLSTNGKAFFGDGDALHPAGLGSPLDGNAGATGPESALLLERRLQLKSGESRTLYFGYGYLPAGFGLDSLIAKYRTDLPALWKKSSANWKEDGLRLKVESEPWVERELSWHNYYLRSNVTFDDFFGEHILSQGHVYQYVIGFQGAARDPLQHVLPFVFSNPDFVKSVLRYTLKEVQPDGSIPYGIVGHGMPMPAIYRPSDLELWLLWVASEYVLATRDRAFLDESLLTYPLYGEGVKKETVGRLLARCYKHLIETTGTGQHGLLRLSNGDWNDNVVVGQLAPAVHAEVRKGAESVLNAAMATYVLDYYARLLTFAGDSDGAAAARQAAERQRIAVRAQWVGQWFRRAWLTPELGWIGEDQIWLEPQPWAILGGASTAEQTPKLLKAIDEHLRRPSPIGAMLLSKGFEKVGSKLGDGTNTGIWPSINGTLIWALARLDGVMGWDEWKKNSLAKHAEAYPEIWYGIWSGPDTFNSVLSRYPGQTLFGELVAGPTPGGELHPSMPFAWTDYPVMNMHPHAWQLYTAAKLIGVEFNEHGVELAPTLPLDAYTFGSPLLGLKKSQAGYEGWYAPGVGGECKITLRLPRPESARLRDVEVNSRKQRAKPGADGSIRLEGSSSPGKPLRWAVRF